MKICSVWERASRVSLAAVICLGLAGAAQAANDQTAAGTSVSNTFVLNYSVGLTNQPPITNDNVDGPPGAVVQGTPTLFTVDRKIDLIVTATNSTLNTVPGASPALTFTVENEGNDTSAYSFSVTDLGGNTNDFNLTGTTVSYLLDANDNGTADDGAFTAITPTTIGDPSTSAFVTIDVPKGVQVFVEVQGSVPEGTADASTDELTLVAEARDPTAFLNETPGDPGAVTLASTGANALEGAAQNVLADGTGVAGAENAGDRDGLYAATGDVLVQSPDLLATKTVEVIKEPGIADPFVALTDCSTASAVTDAKAVPGACVEYVIEVENTGATVAASNLNVSDVLPAEVTFISATLATTTTSGFIDDTAIAGAGPDLAVPATNTLCDGTPTTCQITLSDAELAAAEIGQIVIRAIIK